MVLKFQSIMAKTFALLQCPTMATLCCSIPRPPFPHGRASVIPPIICWLEQVLHIGHQLYSSTNITTNDYSTGRYGLDVANGGNVLLTAFRNGDPAYNYKGTSENTTAIVFNQTTALLYVVNATEITYPMTTKLSVSVEDYYRRAFLDDQGNLRQLYRIKNGGDDEWITAWKLIEKPCLVSNICGAFGICTNGNDITICECLEGYVPIDPTYLLKVAIHIQMWLWTFVR